MFHQHTSWDTQLPASPLLLLCPKSLVDTNKYMLQLLSLALLFPKFQLNTYWGSQLLMWKIYTHSSYLRDKPHSHTLHIVQQDKELG